ncbi:MAG: nuclear transport factor 2 family protein [Bacteroidota bacterium]
MRFITCLLIALTPLGLFAQTYTGPQEDIDHILKNIKSFSKHVVAADYDKIAASYTEDGKIFPNNRDIIGGRKDVRQYWVLPEGYATIAHKITPSEIKVLGDEAYDYGYYEGKSRRPDGAESSWKGKYVIVWKKVDGEWLIYLDIWNAIGK